MNSRLRILSQVERANGYRCWWGLRRSKQVAPFGGGMLSRRNQRDDSSNEGRKDRVESGTSSVVWPRRFLSVVVRFSSTYALLLTVRGLSSFRPSLSFIPFYVLISSLIPSRKKSCDVCSSGLRQQPGGWRNSPLSFSLSRTHSNSLCVLALSIFFSLCSLSLSLSQMTHSLFIAAVYSIFFLCFLVLPFSFFLSLIFWDEWLFNKFFYGIKVDYKAEVIMINHLIDN